MDNVTQAQTRALEVFDSGRSCAESVLQSLQEVFGLESDIVNAAAGFGGGIGRCGSVCGAMAGAVIALGLAEGAKTEQEGTVAERVRGKVQRINDAFISTFGTVNCREMTGHDLRNPEQYELHRNSDVRVRVCQQAVKLAIQKVLEP